MDRGILQLSFFWLCSFRSYLSAFIFITLSRSHALSFLSFGFHFSHALTGLPVVRTRPPRRKSSINRPFLRCPAFRVLLFLFCILFLHFLSSVRSGSEGTRRSSLRTFFFRAPARGITSQDVHDERLARPSVARWRRVFY